MKRRKIFSLVLAGVMLFSNITSFAAETTYSEAASRGEASESSTEITTESVTTEENSVDEAETTTIEISDETASIDETTETEETSEITTYGEAASRGEEVDEENTYGFVKFSVSYDTLLSDVSFSVYDSNETQVAVYIVSDAKVSFIDLLVDKDILYEQDEETLLSLENGDYYLSMDETVYDGDSTPSDAGIVYDDSKVEFTVNSEELTSPLEVEVSLEELVTEEVTETSETSEATTEGSTALATPSDISSDTEDITYVTAASETENAVSSEGIVLVTGTFGSLTAVVSEDAEIIVFDHYYSEIDESLVETTDLIVTTSDESIFTKNTNVISNYDNAYIISCDTVEEARYVYSYYVDKVDTISDLSKTISVATDDSEDVADLSDLNNDDDSLSTLNDIDTKTYSGYIALIDTGADADVNFSVIGDDTSDTNGHGTKYQTFSWEETSQTQVYKGQVQAWAYANIELTLTKAIDDDYSSFTTYCNNYSALKNYYSLEGTTIEVYTDSSCSTHLKDVDGNNITFKITSENTLSKTFTIDADYAGKTVYIKETGVGTGYKYNSSYISGKSYTLPDAGESAEVTIANTPMYDPFQWNLQKVSDVSGSTDWSGEINAVSAIYKITGYKLTSSNGKGTQFGTWYAKTDSNGKIKFTDSSYYTSDSDELYIDDGVVEFPIGYYTIEETAVSTSSGIKVSDKTYTYIIYPSDDDTGANSVLKDGSTVIYSSTVSNSTSSTYTNDNYMITLADGSTTLGTNTSGSFLVIDDEEWAKLGLFKTDEVYIEEGYTANNSVLKEDNAGTSFSGAVFNTYVDASKVSGFSASSFFTKPYDNHTYSLTKVDKVVVSDQLGNSKTSTEQGDAEKGLPAV